MPRQAKVEASKKVQIVEEYLSGKISRSGTAYKCNVDQKTIAEWVSHYLSESACGLITTEHNIYILKKPR